MSNDNLISKINKQLADWTVLSTKLHNYHWYVKGEQFFTLHEKFEELYNLAASQIDELAERILAIKGKPVATLTEYLELSTVKESNKNEDAFKMVENIADDFEAMVSELNVIITLAEEAQDQPTADMFIALRATIEKHVWMLQAFNQK
ncbi:Dps family protein [Alkalihalobacillus trypoxylicola]|uniref:DNA starvation/stationary phase protection protein n=1 Tax=Alkalihalobacillus trypoxylicola TaxID=519424 RepID=A0A161Q772_9BACI|nr:DNA starvation/stationary phase protection protein [Alkalihalobacillus trypoxylicola]KYG32328.1 DNA starvation/stationary phase protection protein [Alkalihalobacillus trypoxylicola]